MSNDELQKAIDDITNSGAADVAGGETAGEAAVNLDAMVGNAMPEVPEVPEMPTMPMPETAAPAMSMPEVAMPVAPAPEMPAVPAPEVAQMATTPEMSTMTVAPEIPAPETPAPVETPEVPKMTEVAPEMPAAPEMPKMPEMPVVEAAPEMPKIETEEKEVGGELEEIKKDALLELYPLLDKMKVNSKQKFDICMKVVNKTGEKKALGGAMKAAKEMSDPDEKGAALMQIIEKIDAV